MEAFLEPSTPGGDPARSPSPIAPARRAVGPRRTNLTRTVRLAVVAFVFATLGALTPGELRPEAGLLAAELGISLVAILLVVGSLSRSG
jgi:hypothetical protein